MLIHETSPYLLQHAYNPVDWYPWGDEALQRARREDKPILLSIGYSSCHWCHVMEKETFENHDIARIMNEHFICIKVDREELPDVDALYMNAVQIMTGSGGWPLNVFLTPDLVPFHGGTYFPPEDRWGRSGFPRVLQAVAKAYREDRGKIHETGSVLVEAMVRSASIALGKGNLSDLPIEKAVEQMRSSFDPVYGGFGGAPKFPPAMGLKLLLREHRRRKQRELLSMVVKTLDAMASGGIYDHLGGGFHRYSTDRMWLVPHFEKMLYDQALLSDIYLEAFQATGKHLYRRIAGETLEYVLRELQDPAGGFFSSQDADSDGDEGKYYVWTNEEVREILGQKEGPIFASAFGITNRGNFEGGKNILFLPMALEELAEEMKIDCPVLEERLKRMKERMLGERNRRVSPSLDDKIIVSWNALMISSMVKGYSVLGEERFLDAAKKAADFLMSHLWKGGGLHHTWRRGEVKIPGYLDDHAFLSIALLELYESTFEVRWLREAQKLLRLIEERFCDEAGDGFFSTSKEHPHLLMRVKDHFDGAIPSGNAMAVSAFLCMARLLGSHDMNQKGEAALRAFASALNDSPMAFHQMLLVLQWYLEPLLEIAIIGKRKDPDTEALLQVIHQTYLPFKVVAFKDPEETEAGGDIPFLMGKGMVEGKSTAYVCEGQTCLAPVTTPKDLKKILLRHAHNDDV